MTSLNGDKKIIYAVMTIMSVIGFGLSTTFNQTDSQITEDRIESILLLIKELDEEINEVNDEIDKLQLEISDHESIEAHQGQNVATAFLQKQIDRLQDRIDRLEDLIN